MSRLAGGLLLAALCLTPDDEADVRAVIDKFFAAANKKDAAGAQKLWSEKSADTPHIGDRVNELSKPLGDVSTGAVVVKGDVALATVRFKGAMLGIDALHKDETHARWRVEFRREAGAWKWWTIESASAVFARELVDEADPKARRSLLTSRRGEIGLRLLMELDKMTGDLMVAGEQEKSGRAREAGLEAAEHSGRDDLKALALLTRGSWLMGGGAPGAAIEPLRKAQQHAFKAQENELLAQIGTRLGFALADDNQHLQATIELAAARKLAEEGGYSETLVTAQNYTGLALGKRGDYEQALQWHQLAFDNANHLKDVDLALDALNELAHAKWELGNYEGARADSEQGLKVLGESQGPLRAKFLNTLGIAYLASGRNREALKHLLPARVLWTDLKLPKRVLGVIVNNIGEAHRREKDYGEAEKDFSDALDILVAEKDAAMAGIARNNSGLVYYQQGDKKKALEHFKACLEGTTEDKNPGLRAMYLLNLAEVRRRFGEHTPALEHAREAAGVMDRKGTDPGRFIAQLSIGLIQKERNEPGDLAGCLAPLKKAATYLEGLRAGLRDPALQQSFLADHAPLYSEIAGALHQLKRDPEAFAAAEEGKARTLTDLLAAGSVRIVKAMTDPEREEESRLEKELQKLGRQLQTTFQTDARTELESKIESARGALEQFRREAFQNHPELPVLRGRSAPASIDDLNRRVMKDGTAVLSYLVGIDETLLFILRPGNPAPTLAVQVISIPQATLEKRVSDFWSACSRADGDTKASARSLYGDLLLSAITALGPEQPVAIIPDGPLHALPFHALEDEKGVPLVEQRSVVYAPSATALVQMTELAERRRAEPAKDLAPLLAVGSPQMPPGYSDLPHSKPEVEKLAERYKVSALTGADATEAAVKVALEKARRIHISTHGKADEASPLYSYVVLAADKDNDGKLEARELVDLSLRADLVVLSACETARGKQMKGEGVVGLTWALFAAGAPATVLSQWQVADESTAELMKFFHEEIKPGVPFAEALRAAQRKLRKNPARSHPYYWAPFIVVGAGRG